MSNTLVAEYVSPDVNEAVPRGPKGEIRSTARLGPFHAPVGVAIAIESKHLCKVRFHYVNDEQPESVMRRSADHPDVEFLLGRKTRKILAVTIRNLRSKLEPEQQVFDPRVAREWCAELTTDRQWTCLQNAVVASSALREMPADIRQSLLRMLESKDA